MKTYKFAALVVVSIIIAILLATALTSFTRISDSALADNVTSPQPSPKGKGDRPSTAGTNYLPIIFLNSATAGGAWLLGGNAGTNSLTDFLGTTDNMTLTFRVSNTVAYRIVPTANPLYGFAPNIIGGSPANRVSPGLYGATIAGGGTSTFPNVISGTGTYAFVGGGAKNTASNQFATVGGGQDNNASNQFATVGGGIANTASGDGATISGGGYNAASGGTATIGGGFFNASSGQDATVGGGSNNSASGFYATVPGGSYNTASGDYSLAAGYQAQALHQGAFVWADSTNATFPSTGNDQFLVRANGGAGIGTNSPGWYALNVQRNGGSFPYQVAKFKNASASGDQSTVVDLQNGNASPTVWRVGVGGTNNGWGLTAGQLYFESGTVALQIDANHDFHLYPSGGGSCNLSNGAAGWACSSDRNLKENIVRANGEEILARVAALPVSTWNMKGTEVTHIGPMAQDFYAAFNVGEDDKHINTVDAQGVALAAIQGLAKENKELKAKNEKELTELTELKSEVEALRAQGTGTSAIGWRDVVTVAAIALVAMMWVRKKA